MIKKFFATMLLAVTFALTGIQTNTAEAAIQVVGIRTYLSIRESPSVYSRELARVPNGTIFYEVFDDQRAAAAGFFAIRYRGIMGYVSSRYVRYI